jgi:hypothetical protein
MEFRNFQSAREFLETSGQCPTLAAHMTGHVWVPGPDGREKFHLRPGQVLLAVPVRIEGAAIHYALSDRSYVGASLVITCKISLYSPSQLFDSFSVGSASQVMGDLHAATTNRIRLTATEHHAANPVYTQLPVLQFTHVAGTQIYGKSSDFDSDVEDTTIEGIHERECLTVTFSPSNAALGMRQDLKWVCETWKIELRSALNITPLALQALKRDVPFYDGWMTMTPAQVRNLCPGREAIVQYALNWDPVALEASTEICAVTLLVGGGLLARFSLTNSQ